MAELVFFVESPYLTIEKYAKKVGFTVRTVEGQIANGHLPTVKHGKRLLINYALICKQALEAEY